MFGEALEDLESCGQSELLRELEVGPPPHRASWGPPCMDTPMCVPVGSKHVDGVLLVCCVCHALLGALRVKRLRTRAHCAWTHIQVRLRALWYGASRCVHT